MRAVIVSYRLGGTDGVSVEAAKWHTALEQIGFAVTRVAGRIHGPARTGDLEAGGVDDAERFRDAILTGADGRDLVVMENVCSLPVHPAAAAAAAGAAADLAASGVRVVLHHHDLPWQRPNLAGTGGPGPFPPDIEGALHVTVNERSRRELAVRGIPAVTVHNRFEIDPEPGDRDRTRGHLGFGLHDLVLLHPARAIERKNVPGGLEFAEALDTAAGGRVVYWITGPAEDGYGPTLERLLAGAGVRTTVGRAPCVADAYAAADAVVFPSTWEGFGNPVIESVAAGRPLAAGRYPVLDEITSRGLRFFPLDDPGALARWLARPDPEPLAANRDAARRHFSIDGLPEALARAFAVMGWS